MNLLLEVEWFHQMLDKHIDLLERRIIKGEAIPHEEKVFSIFQPYTEWINKGKRNVEIGKKVFVTTDQYHLIVDYMIGEKQQDEQAFVSVVDQVKSKWNLIKSWSVDKGFSSKENKQLFQIVYPETQLIMSKKGKRNKQEEENEVDDSNNGSKHQKTITSCFQGNVNGQPIGFQYRNQWSNLRIHMA